MKLDINEIIGNVGKRHTYQINEPSLEGEDPGVKCTAPIVGTIDFQNTGTHIFVQGEVNTKAELECSRCTGAFEVPVQVKFDDDFNIAVLHELVDEEEDTALEKELEEEPVLENGIFDLSEFLRQTILVSLPIKPLCNDACKGLCLTCGTNLNEGACDCPVVIEASPFAALKELLEENEESREG